MILGYLGAIGPSKWKRAVARLFPLSFAVLMLSTASQAQNLDTGKSDAETFNSNCASCHGSARELARNRSAQALKDFLRRHYTTNAASAAALAEYLVSGVSRPGSPGAPVAQSAREPNAPPPLKPAPTGANPQSRSKRATSSRWHDPKDELWPGCPDAYSCFPLYGGYGR